jgi:transposase InsO family protein
MITTRPARASGLTLGPEPALAPPNRSLRELLALGGIRHRFIPPRTPKRNGKVERYQQTLAREWAYGQRYRSSDARATALPIWPNHYNTTRNHSGIGNRPPISRVRNELRQDI